MSNNNVIFICLSIICILVINCNKNDNINTSIPVASNNGIKSVTKTISNNSIIKISFGEYEEGESIVGQFVLINDLDFPVKLELYKQSCGCSVLDFPEKIIEPGEYSVITASPITSKLHVMDEIEINIMNVLSNNIKYKNIYLLVEGYQKEQIKFHNLSYSLGNVEVGKSSTVYNLLTVPDVIFKSDFEILSVTSDSLNAKLEINKLKSTPNNPHVYQIIYNNIKTKPISEKHAIFITYQYDDNVYQKNYSITSSYQK